MNLDTSSQEPHKLTPMEGLSVLSNQIYPCQSVVSLCCRLILVLGELAFLKFFLKLYLGSWRDGLVLAEDQCSIPNTLMKVHNCPKTSYKIGKMWKSIGLFFFLSISPIIAWLFYINLTTISQPFLGNTVKSWAPNSQQQEAGL